MKKTYFLATIMVGVMAFAAGFLLRPLVWPGEERQETVAEPEQDAVVEVQQELSAQELAAQGYLSLETLKVRIDDGEVQWYDGTVWHTAATVEEMKKEDKFYAAEEIFQEFEEHMKQKLEAHRAEQESISEQEETLLVGQKVEPKPTEKPRPTQPTVTDPATVSVPEPAAPPEDKGGSQGGSSGTAGGGNPGGGNPGGGDSGNTGNTGGDNSGDDSGNTGDSGNSGGDTGDGENMEWTDDYL